MMLKIVKRYQTASRCRRKAVLTFAPSERNSVSPHRNVMISQREVHGMSSGLVAWMTIGKICVMPLSDDIPCCSRICHYHLVESTKLRWHEMTRSGLQGYPTAMGAYYGQNATQTALWPLASSIAQQLQQLGCQGLRIPELQIEPVSNMVWCHGLAP